MRISVNWLRELVATERSPQALAETLTLAGFEVEAIEDLRTWADGVVLGRIQDCQPHPHADRLSVCRVELGGTEPAQIVCGAPNVRAGQIVPVATVGTDLPAAELTVRASELRGVRSEGMICSLAELGLAQSAEGIYTFAQAPQQLGSDARPWLGLDDVILDVTTTANRADALSMVGIAREVAALTGATLHLPNPPAVTPSAAEPEPLQAAVASSQACPAYIGTLIANLQVAPSPQWLQRQLQAAGIRPINNVVDATNYVLLEWGQPLHAFDHDRLQAVTGSNDLTLGVRFAREGESLRTLDGSERTLSPQALLVTANDHPVALAGVMGGEATEVDATTRTIVLEAAVFDPATVRRSARSQGERTEASTRYERGVNPAALEVANRRAAELLQSLAGGDVGGQAAAGTRPEEQDWRQRIELRHAYLQRLLGPIRQGDSREPLPPEAVERTLGALGCQLQKQDRDGALSWTVTVPAHRYRDLTREVDLVEEVARLYGYDHFCETLPARTQPGGLSLQQRINHRLREAFRAIGLTEAVHYSLVKPQGDEIQLANPFFREYSALRPDLIGSAIEACALNHARGNGALNAFEIGRRFWRGPTQLQEESMLAGIMGGERFPQGRWQRSGQSAPMSWFEAKGLLESAFARLQLTVTYQPSDSDARLHPGRTAALWWQERYLGAFGQLHPELCQQRELPEATYAFSLHLSVLQQALGAEEQQCPRFQPVSAYPAAERDLAFFVSLARSVGELTHALHAAGGELLEAVELFDEYRGERAPEGQRSLAFRLRYRARDRTLTEPEIEACQERVRSALVTQFGAELRS